MSVLGSSATKREAKSYLQRFYPPKDSSSKPKVIEPKPQNSRGNGVNLGEFYGPAAVEESPKFVQQPEKQERLTVGAQMHVALVKSTSDLGRRNSPWDWTYTLAARKAGSNKCRGNRLQ
jgi:amino-acid N-acetyltransferase